MLVGYIPINTKSSAKDVIEVTGTSQQMAVGGHYLFSNKVAQSTGILPPNPVIGDEVTVDNGTGRFDLIVDRNGQLMDTYAENCEHNVTGALTYKFVGSSYGWRLK